jgi:hypothetical protein
MVFLLKWFEMKLHLTAAYSAANFCSTSTLFSFENPQPMH